jgi:hypothetical protein
VAGCDYSPHLRERFLAANPGAFVTDDARAFLARDFDAVLLATYCPAHADDAIASLEAGKHVLSEVTAFHTMAEGVRLVEAVERSGRVYSLAENYPLSAATMWLKRRWDEGLFGDLMYAESEYLHEVLALCYTYLDGTPIIPGWQAHSWRSWMHYHYYNFARQIREGVPAPFDVYAAADCTIPGILAYRSQAEGGTPQPVPDFRRPAEREPYRTDEFRQPRYDFQNGLFPADADRELTGIFFRFRAHEAGPRKVVGPPFPVPVPEDA